jgi:hypothetical protein
MRRTSTVVLRAVGFIALAAGASCAEQPLQPMSDLSATQGTPQFTTYDPATKTLGVTITGVSKVKAEWGDSTFRYTGSFTGGVRPFKMYWFVRLCYTDGYCSPRYQVASGTDVDYADIFIPSDATQLEVILFAGDSQSESFTGNYYKDVLGPAFDIEEPWGPCLEDPPTYMGQIYYPFYNPVPPDPPHQTGWYYNKTCPAGRVYEPE